jgi:hypothetical protein
MRDIHFSFARGVWCFVFGGVCGGFWHTPFSAMMVMMKFGKVMTLPRLDVFCGGLVITNKCTKLCSELKLDTKLFPSRMLRSICVRCATSCHFSFVSFFARERR